MDTRSIRPAPSPIPWEEEQGENRYSAWLCLGRVPLANELYLRYPPVQDVYLSETCAIPGESKETWDGISGTKIADKKKNAIQNGFAKRSVLQNSPWGLACIYSILGGLFAKLFWGIVEGLSHGGRGKGVCLVMHRGGWCSDSLLLLDSGRRAYWEKQSV